MNQIAVTRLVSVMVASATSASSAFAGVQISTSYAEWSSLVGGGDAKIDFVFDDPSQIVLIDEQYAELGVHFVPPTAGAAGMASTADGWGLTSLFGANGTVPILFDVDQHSFAVDYVSGVQFSFFKSGPMGDTLVHSSGTYLTFEPPKFVGFVFDKPFDKVVVWNGGLGLYLRLDNAYVGNPIPMPAAFFGLAFALPIVRRRHRRL